MLEITIPGEEGFDENEDRFLSTKPEVRVKLEHSLVSVSKWESEIQVAFLGKHQKSEKELFRYIELMMLNPPDDETAITRLSAANASEIKDYISSPASATRLMQLPGGGNSREVITSELIYYWMVALQIPWEAQHWHLNRLLTLVDLIQRKQNSGNTKMSKADMAKQRARINQQRRQGRAG